MVYKFLDLVLEINDKESDFFLKSSNLKEY